MRTLFSLFIMLTLATPLHAATREINGIAAVVNDDVITRNELERRVDTLIKQLSAKGTRLPSREILKRQLLERMIIENLQLEMAKKRGIQVADEQLNQIIDDIAKRNGMSMKQFRAALKKDGIAFAGFREQIRNEVIVSRLKNNMVNSRVNVSPQEVDAFLKGQAGQSKNNTEYHLRHILVSLPGNASPEQIQEKKRKAEGLLARLNKGQDFRQVAISYSDGPQALEGGDLGWRKRAQLPTLFAETVGKMKKGDVSPLIRSSGGFHILKLINERGEKKVMLRQANARHILIATNKLVSSDEARKRITRLRQRIVKGEDFAKMARINSDDTGSGAKGGNLGWADPSIYVPEFQKALKETKVKTISQPFKTQFGWHIVQPLGWRTVDNTEEAKRSEAFAALRQRKAEEETQNWLRQLRDQAYVEYRLDQ
jgi:peptidyl-prolyl cis-trans isomerase SurA